MTAGERLERRTATNAASAAAMPASPSAAAPSFIANVASFQVGVAATSKEKSTSKAIAALTLPRRRFAFTLATIMVATLASAALPSAHAGNTIQFGLITLVVMLLVRRVVGDREQRAQIAERELPAGGGDRPP